MTGENQPSTTSPWLRTIVIGRNPKRTLVRIIVLILLSVALIKFVFIPVRVTGISMSPNYADGRINLVNKLAYAHSRPERGDVVAIKMAGEHVMLLKRIIGLPGERVTIRLGNVFINDAPFGESYVKYKKHPSWNKKWVLKEDEYLVMGDNRSMPFEAHYYGLAYEHQIAGKVVF